MVMYNYSYYHKNQLNLKTFNQTLIIYGINW